MFMYNCTHRHHCCDLIWLIRNITDSPKPYFKHGPILSCCDRPAQLTLATDPPVNEERTVMLVETSKMLVANILPTPAGCVEARPGQPSRAPSTCGRGRWRSLNKFQIKYKLKMNQREESKIRAPTRDQRCRGQAWRRLTFRYSATRRPYTFQFYTRVAIARSIVTDVCMDQFEEGFKTKNRA